MMTSPVVYSDATCTMIEQPQREIKMPVMNADILRQRIMQAIVHYEQQKLNTVGYIHPKRQEDMHTVLRYIETIRDGTLLENEIISFLNKIGVRYAYLGFLFKQTSYFKELIMSIIRDENKKYTMYTMWLLSNRVEEKIKENSNPVSDHPDTITNKLTYTDGNHSGDPSNQAFNESHN